MSEIILPGDNKPRCPSCGSTNVFIGYDTIECHDCYHFHITELDIANSLDGDEIYKIVLSTIRKHNITNPTEINAIISMIQNQNTSLVVDPVFEHVPVDIEELINSDKYLLPVISPLYPFLKEELILIFRNPNITDIHLSGSLGWGKTFFLGSAFFCINYYLNCLKDPQKFFGLASHTYISLFNFAPNDRVARKTLFNYLLNGYDMVPWFSEHAPRDRDKSTEIDLPGKRIIFLCGGANPGVIIGSNLHTWAGDEMNFMEVVKDSKRSKDGEDYDEAKNTSELLTTRQKSRKTNNIPYCPQRRFRSSSERFPDNYLPVLNEAMRNSGRVVTREQLISGDYDKEKCDTYIMSYANWETKPKKLFPSTTFICDQHGNRIYYDKHGRVTSEDKGEERWKTFKLGLGHPKKGDRVLSDNEAEEGYTEIINVPVHYHKEFVGVGSNLYQAIRDIAGRSTMYNNPWFRRELIVACTNKERHHPCSLINPTLNEMDFKINLNEMFKWGGGLHFKNADKPRFAHLDLSTTGDDAGIGICHIDKMVNVIRRVSGNLIMERLPFIYFDFLLRIKAPGQGMKIDFSKIRNIIYLLRKHGMFFKMITYDRVEGEMGTFLDKNQIGNGYLSLDKNIEPWDNLSQSLIEKRVEFYDYPLIEEELPYLYYDEIKKKIDHRPNKKKDLSDCIAGATWNAVTDKDTNFNSFLIKYVDSEDNNIQDIFQENGVSNFYGKGYGY